MFCAICENKSSNTGPVITCKNCCRGFHKFCHRPIISDIVPKPWFCRRCASLPTPKKVIAQQRIEETIKKSVAQPSPIKIPPSSQPPAPPSPKKSSLDFKWDANHLTNNKNEYCYCKRNGYWLENMLQCRKCRNWFHFKCIKVPKKELNKYEYFNIFVCSNCNSGKEYLVLLPLSWGEVVYTALLMHIHSPIYPKVKGYVNVEEVMLPYLHQKWNKIHRLTPELIKADPEERTRKILETLNKYTHWFSWGRKAKQKYMHWKLHAKVPPFSATILPDNLPLRDAAVLEFCKKEMSKPPLDLGLLSRGSPKKDERKRPKDSSTINCTQNKRAAKMRGSTQAEEGSNGNDNTPTSSLDRLIPTPSTFENANHPFSAGSSKTPKHHRKERKAKEGTASIQTSKIILRKRLTKSNYSPLPSSSPLPALPLTGKKRGRKPKAIPTPSSLNKNNLMIKLEKILPPTIKIPPMVKKRGRPLKSLKTPLQPLKTENKKQRPGRKRKITSAIDSSGMSDQKHQKLEAEEALKKYSLDQLDLEKYVVKAMRVTPTGEKQYLLEIKKS